MAKVLYLEASPRGDSSYSSRVAKEFLKAYQAKNPEDEVEVLSLFDADLPTFSAQGANQKMENIINLVSGGKGLEAEGEWAGVIRESDRLKSADKVVLSSPMWNFSIPYRLKHWIDVVTQPGVTFVVDVVDDAPVYTGLVTDKPLQMILASGSPYEMRFPRETDGTKTDFQRAYLEHAFRFMGFSDMRLIKVQPTGIPGPDLEAAVVSSEAHAREAALMF
ncbi:FMN-dependent NADH-azoreductase [Maricurvus nonylphenolicus]|uniref:FMN-dependent NADH-azoreductase n=1 Tax=Maricurvus nonylphenolicus TaxID=1008307 RepID=UPI0036F39AAC